MWVVVDVSSTRLNADANYTTFQNNGMFFIPTAGPHSGSAFQFASGPSESELTGPSWTPDEQTLFLSVQHPGERSKSLAELSTRWPDSKDGMPPRPAIVVISNAQGSEPNAPALEAAIARALSWHPAMGAWMIGSSTSCKPAIQWSLI